MFDYSRVKLTLPPELILTWS